MKLLLDEMHSPLVAEQVRARGYDAIAVKERAELIGLSDPRLLDAATADGRTLVTENVKDFGPLHRQRTAAGEHHAGLVFTHPRRFPRSASNHVRVLTDALAQLIDTHSASLRSAGSFVWWLERPGSAWHPVGVAGRGGTEATLLEAGDPKHEDD